MFLGLRGTSRSLLGRKQKLANSIKLYRFTTLGPLVSAPRISLRRLGVLLSRMQIVRSLSHKKVPSDRLSSCPPTKKLCTHAYGQTPDSSYSSTGTSYFLPGMLQCRLFSVSPCVGLIQSLVMFEILRNAMINFFAENIVILL